MNLRTALVLAAAAVPAVAAHAEPEGQEIVVNGAAPLNPREAVSHVAQITRATAGQVARYHNPICPAVMGLSARNSDIVTRRIRALAVLVGAEADPKARCNANLIVMIASDAKALFADARKRKLSWFAGVRPSDIAGLAASDGPVKVWHVTSTRNEDGQGAGVYGEDLEGATLQVRSVSMFHKPTRQDIDGAVIIIERAAIEGLTLNQIASYVTMRTLARTDVPKDAKTGTVLTLFSPGAERSTGLTPADEIYLKTLYAGNGTLSDNAQLTTIAARLSRP